MIRLIAATAIATVLWPVDENNRPLPTGISAAQVTEIVSTGYSVVEDLMGFCDRNEATCSTVSYMASQAAADISARFVDQPESSERSEDL